MRESSRHPRSPSLESFFMDFAFFPFFRSVPPHLPSTVQNASRCRPNEQTIRPVHHNECWRKGGGFTIVRSGKWEIEQQAMLGNDRSYPRSSYRLLCLTCMEGPRHFPALGDPGRQAFQLSPRRRIHELAIPQAQPLSRRYDPLTTILHTSLSFLSFLTAASSSIHHPSLAHCPLD
jgi:hypothetical protein